MLTHPTLDLLHDLGLHGMAKGFKELEQAAETRTLKHAEWLGLLLEHEATLRRQKRFEARARTARLRHDASVEDVDYHAARGLDRAMFLKLASGDFIRERRNLLITGPCGVGKSWLACALGHKACREDFSVLYHRMPRLFAALALARGDGRYAKLLRTLARVDLLILDDWDRSSSMPNNAATSWRSSRIDTTSARLSLPASFQSSAGTRSSAIRRLPTPSSIASSITPTESNSLGTACASTRPAKPSSKLHYPQRRCRKAQARPHPRRQKCTGNDRRAQLTARPGGSTGTSRAPPRRPWGHTASRAGPSC